MYQICLKLTDSHVARSTRVVVPSKLEITVNGEIKERAAGPHDLFSSLWMIETDGLKIYKTGP